MITHEYHLLPDHSIAEVDLLPQTIQAIEDHDRVYNANPLGYFQIIANARRLNPVNKQPFLHFKNSGDSDTDFVFAQLAYANRLFPANTSLELAEYAKSEEKTLPDGMKPNAVNQSVKHHLTYTTLAGIPEIRDAKGRPLSLVVVTSPSMDFHQPELSREQSKQLKNGDFTPTASAMVKIAETLNAERVHLTGYSKGAAEAAKAAALGARNFDIASLTVSEPTTFKARTRAQIMAQYTILDAFNGTSGDKNLEKVPNTGFLQHGPQALRDLDRNGNGGWLDNLYGNGNIRTNLQLARALGRPSLLSDLEVIYSRTPITVFYAEDSLMTKGIERPFLSELREVYIDEKCDSSDMLQLLKVRSVGAAAAKHIVGESPALYADQLARGVRHGAAD